VHDSFLRDVTNEEVNVAELKEAGLIGVLQAGIKADVIAQN
jgi:hypothetical protein